MTPNDPTTTRATHRILYLIDHLGGKKLVSQVTPPPPPPPHSHTADTKVLDYVISVVTLYYREILQMRSI